MTRAILLAVLLAACGASPIEDAPEATTCAGCVGGFDLCAAVVATTHAVRATATLPFARVIVTRWLNGFPTVTAYEVGRWRSFDATVHPLGYYPGGGCGWFDLLEVQMEGLDGVKRAPEQLYVDAPGALPFVPAPRLRVLFLASSWVFSPAAVW